MTETDTARQKLAALIADGKRPTAREAASLLGVSRQRAWQLFSAIGEKPAKNRIIPERTIRTDEERQSCQPCVTTGGVSAGVYANVCGTISELLASADLMARGHIVFAPLCRVAKGPDLVIYRKSSKKTERVEVRTGYRRPTGSIQWSRKGGWQEGYVDRYAIVLRGEPVQYFPPFDGDLPAKLGDFPPPPDPT